MADAFTVATKYWHVLDDGRIQCDVCPRACKLREGQRGVCFVRGRLDDQVVLTSYGRSSGFCVDPIEKKPLNHFLPGTSVLSFGTAGCNLACRFCQNWDISKSKEVDTLADQASPEALGWFAITNLLIPGLNDSDAELDAMTGWVVEELGGDVPMHFTAFHPDFKLTDRPSTPPDTLTRARKIAVANGVQFAYTGNVHDTGGSSTYCPSCGTRVVERDWYALGEYRLGAARAFDASDTRHPEP